VTFSEMLKGGPGKLRERKAMVGPVSMLVKAGHLVALPEGAKVRGKARKEAFQIVRVSHAL